MKLDEIEAGGFYEVSVNPTQVQGVWGDERDIIGHPRIVTRFLISDTEGALRGKKGRVIGVERTAHNRPVIRVECVSRKAISKEYVEDNYDGTRTEWSGLVVDEEGGPVMEDVHFEALIQPSQVLRVWEDALVDLEMRKANHFLDHDRERYFGKQDA